MTVLARPAAIYPTKFRVWRLPGPSDNRMWSWVPWDSEPRITVLIYIYIYIWERKREGNQQKSYIFIYTGYIRCMDVWILCRVRVYTHAAYVTSKLDGRDKIIKYKYKRLVLVEKQLAMKSWLQFLKVQRVSHNTNIPLRNVGSSKFVSLLKVTSSTINAGNVSLFLSSRPCKCVDHSLKKIWLDYTHCMSRQICVTYSVKTRFVQGSDSIWS
jgi:hypothetical protein